MNESYYRLRRVLRVLRQHLPQDILDAVCETAYLKCEGVTWNNKKRLERKLKKLCKDSVWSNCGIPSSVINLSSYVLSDVEKSVLSLGLSFALKPDNSVFLDAVSSTIHLKNNLSSLMGLILNSFINSFNSLDSIPRRFRAALENLKKNDSIFITKADKSNAVVIMDKTDYKNKINSLLADTDTYITLTSSPLKRLASEFNKKVKDLLKNVPTIDPSKFLQINPKLPYMYGLPKTHKENIPLRPIISQCGSFSYKLSKFLANKLTPVVGTISNSHIQNSSDFINKIKSCNLTSGKMLSFDVDSLFTNVPIDDVLQFLKRKLPSTGVNLGMPIDVFVELVKLCVDSGAFSHDSKFYMQCFGMSMGSPLSPVLSNLYMEYFETELLPQISPPNMIWSRYVDDICFILALFFSKC